MQYAEICYGASAVASNGQQVTALASAASPKRATPASAKRGKKDVTASKAKALKPVTVPMRRGSSRKSTRPAQDAA